MDTRKPYCLRPAYAVSFVLLGLVSIAATVQNESRTVTSPITFFTNVSDYSAVKTEDPQPSSCSSFPMRVILFGDSLSRRSFSKQGGWGAILATKLERKADVVPRGFSSYNSTAAKMVLPMVAPTFGHPIAAVTVLLGTNDALLFKPVQVPVQEYKENLKWIIGYMVQHGIDEAKIILISPPGKYDKGEFTLHAEACGEVAAEVGCDFLDLHKIMNKEKDQWKKLFLPDGIHFSESGSQVVAEAVWPMIEKRTKDLPRLMSEEWEKKTFVPWPQ